MTNRVMLCKPLLPPLCEREVLRYMSAGNATDEVLVLTRECIEEARRAFSASVCYRAFDLHTEGEVLDLGFAQTQSRALQKNLTGCDRIIVFAATVGIGIDRLIARYASLSPARSLCFGAIGAERIEAACDAFCVEIRQELAANGERSHPRFSPGYGDLPLELQRDIFRVLDCPRQIGLSLSDSLLMTPTKSVTAIIGISKTT